MRLKALDSFHASDLGMFHAGTEFDAPEARGAEIVKRGLAVEVVARKPATETADAERAVETADETPHRAKRRS